MIAAKLAARHRRPRGLPRRDPAAPTRSTRWRHAPRATCRAGRRLFEQRVADGWVCDGHGDLLADDIFCLADGPRVLDCLDFSDELRYGDVLADVAFLAMDLEHRGAPELAARFLELYDEFSGERHPASLVDYYVAFRALIRAKVSALRAQQGDDRCTGARARAARSRARPPPPRARGARARRRRARDRQVDRRAGPRRLPAAGSCSARTSSGRSSPA